MGPYNTFFMMYLCMCVYVCVCTVYCVCCGLVRDKNVETCHTIFHLQDRDKANSLFIKTFITLFINTLIKFEYFQIDSRYRDRETHQIYIRDTQCYTLCFANNVQTHSYTYSHHNTHLHTLCSVVCAAAAAAIAKTSRERKCEQVQTFE